MKNKSINLTFGDVADICGIFALPLALGFAPWLVTIVAVFVAGLLVRPLLVLVASVSFWFIGVVNIGWETAPEERRLSRWLRMGNFTIPHTWMTRLA